MIPQSIAQYKNRMIPSAIFGFSSNDVYELQRPPYRVIIVMV